MIKIVADLHTHTVATDHAFSTLLENAVYAKRSGMQAIAVTEHGPTLPDSPMPWHYGAVAKYLPPSAEGILLISGAETNVLDDKGSLELDADLYTYLQWVIAGIHLPVMPAHKDPGYYSQAYEKLAKNPYIDCIGHCGDPRFVFDYERTIPLFGQQGKVVEINNHSFTGRPGSAENCRKIALLCKKHGVRICVSSDAHIATEVGIFTDALAMLDEIGFPEELVVNADMARLADFINSKPHKKKKITLNGAK